MHLHLVDWILGGVSLPREDIYVEHSTDVENSTLNISTNPYNPSTDNETSTNLEESDTTSVPPGSQPINEAMLKPNDDADHDPPACQSENGEEEEAESIRPTLIFLSNNVFNFESAFKRICELFEEESSNKAENHLITKFRIDMSSRNTVRALGALLKYMDSARVGVEFETANIRTPITAIKTISVDEMVEIDSGTYLALDIFFPEEHKVMPFGPYRGKL
ncbi:unnamed protein product [Strongylus vulgaris]|uniref:Uncharacterized protein n=1 Tax=Strongylus vulgaris TaxID=40348 RepID=A0A3P7IW86_STRVU|nr:unnamed protein product [Strongylus vulgaris]